MDKNPYESPLKTGNTWRTRNTRWLVWAGFTCFVIAAICVAATVVGVIYNYNVVTAPSTVPADLASAITIISLSPLAGVAFGLLGVILLFAGSTRRLCILHSLGAFGFVWGVVAWAEWILIRMALPLFE